MTTTTSTPATTLRIKRIFNVSRDRVFRAWTDPKELKQWCAPGEDYTTPIAEVDLRVGGKYRIGMQPKGQETAHIATGVYREVKPPEKLVYSWWWEGATQHEETLVTVEFRDLGGSTELVLTHELFPDEVARDKHTEGWTGCLNGLAKRLVIQ
jgi:uncharacterized protein YndB with AHSA1/START domain